MVEDEDIRLGEGEGEGGEDEGGEDPTAALQAEIDELKSRVSALEAAMAQARKELNMHDTDIFATNLKINRLHS